MKQRLPLLIWLGCLLAALLVIARTSFIADMSAFLPASPDAGQRMLVEQLRDGTLARLMIVGIEGGSASERHAASKQLAAALRKNGQFITVQNGEAALLERDRQYYFDNRYLLSPAVTPERFSTEGLRQAIDESIAGLSGSAGLMLKSLISRDPTGESLAMLEDLQGQGGPRQAGGVWVARDDSRALLLLQTRAAGSDTDALALAIQSIHDAFAPQHAQGLRLVMTGAGVFSVESRELIKSETSRLATLSCLFIVVLLLSVYRSPRLLALGLLPVVSGALAGIAAVSLGFGHVHGLTLGFGTTLIGEAIDYGIYYFVQAGRPDTHSAWQQRFWRTVLIGVATSVCGFAVLLFSGFPGLAQLGLYSICGLLAAVLCARFVMPRLMPARLTMHDVEPLGHRLLALAHGLSRIRLLLGALILAALGLLLTRQDALWDHSISALNPVPATAQALDAELRADLGAPNSRYLLVRHAAQAEEALLAAEAVTPVLDTLVARGVLGGFDTPSRLLPSAARQRERQAALPDADTLRERLASALADSPLRADRLQGFIDDVAAARSRSVLTRADIDGSASALAIDAMLVARSQGYNLLLPLHAPDSGELDAGAVRAALDAAGHPELLLIDLRSQAESLYSGYLAEAIKLSAWGFAAVLLIIALALRHPARILRVCLPLAGSLILVMAGMLLLGLKLSLLHLIGLLLTVAVGSNYALFFNRAETGQTPGEAARVIVSLCLANISTVVGFGLLATSSVSVLQALGGTVGPGALLCLLLAAAFAQRPAKESPA